MGDLLSQLWMPELMPIVVGFVIILIALYLLSIVWVVRDAQSRGMMWQVWGVVALVPLVGVVAYLLLRQPLLQADREEQKIEIALKERELMKFGECSRCGYPVESDYVLCPNCHQRLKNLCPTCNHALEPSWSICPYCTTQIHAGKSASAASAARTKRTQRTPRTSGVAQAVSTRSRAQRSTNRASSTGSIDATNSANSAKDPDATTAL